MLEHRAIADTIAFVAKHGYALLFWWVLAEQSAVPLPSVPLLLAAGALMRAGKLHVIAAVACCVAASLIADTVWFELGRRRGQRILRLLCRVSLEPDSCVRRTENAFLKYGLKSLLVAKFVPGLNTVAAPLAGSSEVPYWRFLLYDIAGAAIWCLGYFSIGYLFSEQLETILGFASRMGSSLLLLIAALFGLWIVRKFIQRRRFLKQLRVDRITPRELRDRLDAGEELFIVDLRTKLTDSAPRIPNAVQISAEELGSRSQDIPRDREIILFCS
jgi:membrane protein DedA with SNARE-associated domain